MDPTHDCEMFLSDGCRKETGSSLKDEYIPAMVLKNCWPTQSVEEANNLIFEQKVTWMILNLMDLTKKTFHDMTYDIGSTTDSF